MTAQPALKRICVFCGARSGVRPSYADAARQTGRMLAEAGVGVVTGGGHTGLMGEVADGALEAGGEVIGIVPRALVDRELAHRGLTELHVVDSMHERKIFMHRLSDGFICLPGGMGSLDEVLEALTWLQLGVHRKPVGFLNIDGFYGGLFTQLDHATSEGFVCPEQRSIALVGATPAELLADMRRWQAPDPLYG